MTPPRPRPRRRRRRKAPTFTIAAVLLGVAIMAAVWYLDRGDASLRADASDPELVTLGAAVYAKHCASCHGKNLEGEPNWRRRRLDGTLPSPPHDATGHTWHHSDELLFRMTREGPAAIAGKGYRSTMPGFAGVLEDRDILASLAYIKSRWPADIQAAQAKRNATP